MYQLIQFVLAADFFGVGQMSMDTMFGLKIVALVMLYGYMHMNLGGGMLSTAVFLLFGYYFVFYANGIMAVMILALFFLTIHGFDLLWGGDIVRNNIQNIAQQRAASREGGMAHFQGARVPP